MIAILRTNEVYIEDGCMRAIVYPNGNGYLHSDWQVIEVGLHAPDYLLAARSVGLPVSAETLRQSEQELDAWYG